MNKWDYLILGGGITGLSVAYHLKGENYAIYEKDRRVGGTCKTENVNNFLFDYAEHFIRADNAYVRKLIHTLLGNNLHFQNLNSAIYLNGYYIDYPFQTNLYGLPVDIRKECLVGYVKAYCNKNKRKSNNFEDWIYQNFGDGIAKYFMIPYNEKIWTVHPREMTTDWFFSESVAPRGSFEQVIEGALKKTTPAQKIRWYPLQGGIESFSKSFLPFIKNLHLNKKAIKINIKDKKVFFDDGSVVNYRILINTIPLTELVRIIEKFPTTVKKAGSCLRFNSVLCVNLGVDREDLSDKHWIYFPGKEFVFARVYFPKNFSHNMAPKGMSSVSAIITYSEKKPINKKNIFERVKKGLIKAGILRNDDKIIVKQLMNIKYGFNIYDINRDKSVRYIQNFLLKNDIYSIGRYGNWEYSGIEHSILEGKDLSDRLRKISS